MKKGKEYELLVEQIYKELESDADIVQDDFIKGVNSGVNRQIDLSIRCKVKDIDILIIVQAKDWNRKADIKVVDEFKSVIRDVRAQKGILICNSGFTHTAIEYAKKENINLYSAHAALNVKWRLELNIPVIKYEDFFSYEFTLKFSESPDEDLLVNTGGYLINHAGKEVHSYEIINKILTDEKVNKSGGEKGVRIISDYLSVYLNDKWWKLDELIFGYKYLKTEVTTSSFSPEDYRALKDYYSNEVLHSYINYDSLIPVLKDNKSWKPINNAALFNIQVPYIKVDAVNLGTLYSFFILYKKPGN